MISVFILKLLLKALWQEHTNDILNTISYMMLILGVCENFECKWNDHHALWVQNN